MLVSYDSALVLSISRLSRGGILNLSREEHNTYGQNLITAKRLLKPLDGIKII